MVIFAANISFFDDRHLKDQMSNLLHVCYVRVKYVGLWNEFLQVAYTYLGLGLITATACWRKSRSVDSIL